MDETLQILIIEDQPADFRLIEKHLRQQNLAARCALVATLDDLKAVVEKGGWDVVLSDYNMPQLAFQEVLSLVRRSRPGLPVILVSGSVGEEKAVELLKQGVSDFVLKDNLAKLVPAIRRSLREAAEFRARQEAEAALRDSRAAALNMMEDAVEARKRAEQINSVLQEEIAGRTGAERALQESEKRYRRLFDSIQDAVFVNRFVPGEPPGNFIEVNDVACRHLGYTREEMLRKSPFDIDPELDPAEARQMDRKIAEGRPFLFERVHVVRDGRQIPVEISAQLFDLAGQQVVMTVARDITGRKRLETQLRHVQKMEAVGQLAGGVAHDFNNILAVIQMQAGMLKMGGGLKPDQTASAEEIERASKRAASLTRQLLLFSRRQAMQPRDLDLNETVAGVSEMLHRILGEDIRIHVTCAGRPLFIHADPGMMDQVLMNLVVNSRDAMPDGGRLIIETSRVEIGSATAEKNPRARVGSFARLSIMDSGTGIEPEVLPRIFEPFFTTKDVGKGTGLGLATVFGIVEQHQGWIDVVSTPLVGTTFHIHLPLLARQAAPDSRRPKQIARGGNETVLVAEDDPDLRLLIRSVLSRLGYEMLEAPTGVEAQHVWEENRDSIDLLLTDLVMPDGMSGVELARRLQKQDTKLKVIYMSGYSPEIAAGSVSLHEGVDFLPKPFHVHELAATLRARLDS